jgi:hypothetical protein
MSTMQQSRQKRRRILWIFFSGLGLIAIALATWGFWRYHGPAPEQEIFRGITYGCEELPDTEQSGGLMHWVRADLNVPGVSIFTTPMDPGAQAKGFEYKLQHTSSAVKRYGLAAAVNGTLFASESGFIRWPGDLAISSETVVANHVVNHVDPNSYLLWWDDQNNGHFETSKPPPPASLAKAKWGIGGQAPMMFPGYMSDDASPENRTAIGANLQRKLVWIACFDKASFVVVCKQLAAKGATVAIMIDGGTSVAMAIGDKAKNVRPGTVTGNWRPVATHFGFKADPLP